MTYQFSLNLSNHLNSTHQILRHSGFISHILLLFWCFIHQLSTVVLIPPGTRWPPWGKLVQLLTYICSRKKQQKTCPAQIKRLKIITARNASIFIIFVFLLYSERHAKVKVEFHLSRSLGYLLIRECKCKHTVCLAACCADLHLAWPFELAKT